MTDETEILCALLGIVSFLLIISGFVTYRWRPDRNLYVSDKALENHENYNDL